MHSVCSIYLDNFVIPWNQRSHNENKNSVFGQAFMIIWAVNHSINNNIVTTRISERNQKIRSPIPVILHASWLKIWKFSSDSFEVAHLENMYTARLPRLSRGN